MNKSFYCAADDLGEQITAGLVQVKVIFPKKALFKGPRAFCPVASLLYEKKIITPAMFFQKVICLLDFNSSFRDRFVSRQNCCDNNMDSGVFFP